MKELTDPELSV